MVIGAEITIPITHHRLNMGIWQGIYFVNLETLEVQDASYLQFIAKRFPILII
ncbi:YjbQ family protein [Candidatus Venteria ishoeyi]|uniref:YjbQ family protein n=1 Tax=Candidatus Venteria ishoeyi TaxID=1899563 RepID=UPI00387EBFB2